MERKRNALVGLLESSKDEMPSGLVVSENAAPDLTSNQFWAEFIRVQFDKLLLVYTMWFCYHIGYRDGMVGSFGALLYALQSNRFKRN